VSETKADIIYVIGEVVHSFGIISVSCRIIDEHITQYNI